MLAHAYHGYLKRCLRDPISFVMLFHLAATFTHFITWASAYGGVEGGAAELKASRRVAEFDDVVVSLMGLSGWLALLYFARGSQATGQLVVVLEACLLQVAKWLGLYAVLNAGFTLAFYACARGSTYAVLGTDVMPGTANFHPGQPMKNIG